MRLLPLLAALALVAVGCASAGASGRDMGGAAQLAPADSLAFVASSGDLTSSEWHGVGKTLLQALPREYAGIGDLDAQEVDVAVLPGDKAVAFVRAKDATRVREFATKHGAVTRALGEWIAVAQDAAALDAVANATSHLDGNAHYREAMSSLPADALVRAYANGDQAEKLLTSLPGQLESRLIPFGAKFRYRPRLPNAPSAVAVGVEDFRYIAAALTSEDHGLRLEATIPRGGLVANEPPRLAIQTVKPYESALVDEIPAGALAVLDFQVPQGAFEQVTTVPKPLRDLFGKDAVTLPNDLDALLGGETALYVRPGLPTPEVTLVTQPSDTAAASDTLDSLLRSAPKLSKITLYRAVIGGQFVVSTTKQGIEAFRGGGAKLSSDKNFQEAKKQSRMPDRTTGFAYVNAKDALPLLALAGVKVPSDLPSLRTFAAYGAQDNARSTLTAFLGVG
jgi:hypothetical protein